MVVVATGCIKLDMERGLRTLIQMHPPECFLLPLMHSLADRRWHEPGGDMAKASQLVATSVAPPAAWPAASSPHPPLRTRCCSGWVEEGLSYTHLLISISDLQTSGYSTSE